LHLESLRYFRDIVDEKSISKVAKKSHISQSALSQLIHKMEEDMSVQLLTRSNRGVKATEEGEIVYTHAKNILDAYERMTDSMRDYKHKSETVRIYGNPMIVNFLLPCLLKQVKEPTKKMRFDLFSETEEGVLDALERDLCDFVFVDKPLNNSKYQSFYIGREELVWVASAKLNKKKSYSFNEWLNEEMILFDQDENTKNQIIEFLNEHDKNLNDLKINLSANTVEAVRSSIYKGYGIAILPKTAVKDEIESGNLQLINIEGFNLGLDIYLIIKERRYLKPSIRIIFQGIKALDKKKICK